jgi:hypothetical protein
MTTEPRARWPWLIAGAVAVVAAVAVTLALTNGGDQPTAATPRKPGYDLRTPEAAAKSLVMAARTGSGDTLLRLTCVGRRTCVREHAASVDQARLTEARDTIRDGVFELAEHLKHAEFTRAVDGDEPGTKNVPYRTPEMKGDAYLTLTFVRSGGDWLFYSPMT